MQIDLTGKRALVLGGSRGIGRAAGQSLAEAGATVTLAARSPDALEAAAAELPGSEHSWISVDVQDRSSLTESVAGVLAKGPIHILVNNSGGPPPGPIRQARPEAFLQAFEQHLIANHLVSQAVLPGMEQAGYGRILNVISTSVREPIPNLGVSNTIRGAVASWSKTLAREVAPLGITVNNVLPGATRTERLGSLIESWAADKGISPEEQAAAMLARIPSGRMAEPSETAATITFLASPAAAYITGVSLAVDGGRMVSL